MDIDKQEQNGINTVRLNVEIDYELHQQLKMKAVLERTTIKDLVEGAVIALLHDQ